MSWMETIGGFRGGAEGPRPPIFSAIHTMILLWKSFYEMFFNSTFQNVNITLLCTTNTLTMLYAACPEK